MSKLSDQTSLHIRSSHPALRSRYCSNFRALETELSSDPGPTSGNSATDAPACASTALVWPLENTRRAIRVTSSADGGRGSNIHSLLKSALAVPCVYTCTYRSAWSNGRSNRCLWSKIETAAARRDLCSFEGLQGWWNHQTLLQISWHGPGLDTRTAFKVFDFDGSIPLSLTVRSSLLKDLFCSLHCWCRADCGSLSDCLDRRGDGPVCSKCKSMMLRA